MTNVLIVIYLFFNHFGSFYFYTICLLLGVTCGYWAVFVTNASEQFGTNLRATVTTMVPNVVRATAIPLTLSFVALKEAYSMQTTLMVLTCVTFTFAFLGLAYLKETFHRDLDFYEK